MPSRAIPVVSADYWALTVSLASEATDAVTNFLWEAGATGVVEEGEGTPVTVRAFFPPNADAVETEGRLRGYLGDLRQLEVPVGPGTVEVTRVPEEAWADAWRAHFRPVPIGRRLLVAPPWEIAAPSPGGVADGSRLPVVIEPGRAFGTGGHPTTRGCLELLERALERVPAARVLDVGTGSGVLAIAAARLGTADVVAIDVDPDAVAAARGNAERNGVAGRVRVELASLGTGPGPPAELVLANLLGATVITLATHLADRVMSPGRLIAGGLLVEEVPAVVATFVPFGFRLVEMVDHEGWATLLLARDPLRPP